MEKVFVVIKRAAMDMVGDELECLGVFRHKEDARKAMLADFNEQEYNEDDCEYYKVDEDSIYIVGELGFSYDHYWVTIEEKEIV